MPLMAKLKTIKRTTDLTSRDNRLHQNMTMIKHRTHCLDKQKPC